MRRPARLDGSHDEDLKRKLSIPAVARVLALALPYKGLLAFSAFLMLIGNAVQLALPLFGQRAVDDIAKTKSFATLDRSVGIAALLILASAAMGYIQFVVSAYAGNKIVKELRQQVFAHLQRLPVAFFDRSRTGDLGSHLSNDVAQLQDTLTDDVSRFLGNLVMFVGGAAIAVRMNWQLSVIVLAFLFLLMIFFVSAGRAMRKTNRATLDAVADAIGTMTEAMSNIRLVKAFAREAYEDKRVAERLDGVFRLSMKVSKLGAAMGTVGMAGGMLMMVGCGWYGYRGVLTGAFTVGQIAGFVLVLFEMLPAMSQLAALFTRLQRAVGASERIFAILDEPQESPDPPGAVDFPQGAGEVRFEQISFRYLPETEVLTDLSLTVIPGSVTALVGPSGSGKTTLAALLYRFYEPESGAITVDGVEISGIRRRSLRDAIGIVPQEPILFEGTIRENIRYGRLDATDAEVEQAARDANVEEFVLGFADGYDARVGERGVTLSGGQRQRVSIARVLLKDPKILVLDEATSALDNRSEALIREALDRLMRNRTTLVIAHRLSTVRGADQIAVVAEHRILETGTHAELLRRGGLYADLYELVDA